MAIFLTGCCVMLFVIGLVRNSMQTIGLLPADTPRPTATQTPIPTETPIPTDTPLPTNTPLATNTPQPTAQPDTPTAASLGITQDSLKSVYEDFGFTFTEAVPVAGQPRIIGQSPTASVELIGPPDNLVGASLLFAASKDSQENTTNVTYMFALLNGAVYEWDGANEWLSQALGQGQGSTIYGHKRIKLSASPETGLIILTVKAEDNPPSGRGIEGEGAATPNIPCPCPGDTLNCPDFATPYDAQQCLKYCKSVGAGDIHNLDRDGDGNACEWTE